MEYQVRFGTMSARRRPTPGKKFRIAVLGDFSAKGNAGRVEIGDKLAQRKPLVVTHENVDELLERLDVHLQLPAGASGNLIDVPIRSLEDFHPDKLYENVPLFEKLVSLRQKLKEPGSFDKAAAAVRSLATSPIETAAPRRSDSTSVPRVRIENFSDLLERGPKAAEPAELKSLLRDVVGPHVVPELQDQAALIAAVDQSLSDLMRRLLHHPDFQALESLWRSLDFLIHRVELDHATEVVLYDVSAAELAADLAAVESLEESGLYRWLIENPSLDANQGPLSILCSNFVFEQIPPHVELLARIAKIAAVAGAPFLAAIDAACVHQKFDEHHPLIKQAWQTLRELPESVYLALTSPRFMLRWPYGKKTEPIEVFHFEEFTAKSGLSGMLWGNSAVLATVCLTLNYQNTGLKDMDLGAWLSMNEMPFYYYTDKDGDQIALPCTERLVNAKAAERLVSQGIVPVLAIQGRDEVRLGGLKSVRGELLAGPWGQVQIASSSSPAPVAAPTAPAPVEETVPAASAPVEESAVDNELDNLLASLETPEPSNESTEPAPAESAPAESAPVAEVDELDSLLASLESADAATANESAEKDIDDELAALLADL